MLKPEEGIDLWENPSPSIPPLAWGKDVCSGMSLIKKQLLVYAYDAEENDKEDGDEDGSKLRS